MPRRQIEPTSPPEPAEPVSGEYEAATASIVDEVKAALKITSDYALARALGVSKATVSRWSNDRGGMSDEVALRAAVLTGCDPAYYLLRLQLERAHGLGVQAVFEPIVRALDRQGKVTLRKMRVAGILLGLLAMGALSSLPAQRVAASTPERSAEQSILRKIISACFRRWRLALAALAPAPAFVTASAF